MVLVVVYWYCFLADSTPARSVIGCFYGTVVSVHPSVTKCIVLLNVGVGD